MTEHDWDKLQLMAKRLRNEDVTVKWGIQNTLLHLGLLSWHAE